MKQRLDVVPHVRVSISKTPESPPQHCVEFFEFKHKNLQLMSSDWLTHSCSHTHTSYSWRTRAMLSFDGSLSLCVQSSLQISITTLRSSTLPRVSPLPFVIVCVCVCETSVYLYIQKMGTYQSYWIIFSPFKGTTNKQNAFCPQFLSFFLFNLCSFFRVTRVETCFRNLFSKCAPLKYISFMAYFLFTHELFSNDASWIMQILILLIS